MKENWIAFRQPQRSRGSFPLNHLVIASIDWPPAGFCSFPCFEVGPKKHAAPPPMLPEDVLIQIRAHRWEIHKSGSMLAQFTCDRCEDLEAEYAEAITYHVSRITSEILSESEKLRLTGRSTNA